MSILFNDEDGFDGDYSCGGVYLGGEDSESDNEQGGAITGKVKKGLSDYKKIRDLLVKKGFTGQKELKKAYANLKEGTGLTASELVKKSNLSALINKYCHMENQSVKKSTKKSVNKNVKDVKKSIKNNFSSLIKKRETKLTKKQKEKLIEDAIKFVNESRDLKESELRDILHGGMMMGGGFSFSELLHILKKVAPATIPILLNLL